MFALADIGNTTTQIKIYNPIDDKFINNYLFFTEELIAETTKIKISEEVTRVIFSSVVPKAENYLSTAFAPIVCENIKDSAKFNMNDFEVDTKSLGSDFVTNFYGLNDEDNYALISLGTASTITVVNEKKFMTRIIAPGLDTSLWGLSQKVKGFHIDSQLELKPLIDLKGLSSIDAVNFGTFYGHFMMLIGLVDKLKEQFKIEKVFITGGLSNKLKDLYQDQWEYIPDLIFKGLKYFI